MSAPLFVRCVAVLGVVSALVACGGDEATAFPPGLEPLETSTATRPSATGAQSCPEAVNIVTGDHGDYEFAHARGCVAGSVSSVWEALRDADVTVDRRRVNTWMTTRDVEPQYPVSFRVHNIVRDVVTIEFDITWRLGVVEGTAQEPRVVAGRYQKTFGSTFISLLAGSVVARPLDENTTEVEIVRHIKSTGSGAADARAYLQDCFDSLVARVHGRPLPRYN